MPKLIVCLTGMPGAGKSTICSGLEKKGFTTINMGDAVRAEAKRRNLDPTGQNLGKLGESITKMSEIADAGAATGEYTTNAKAAANALNEMKVAYANATSAANLLASAANETKAYHEQVQITTKNLAQLNAIYELELQDTNSHLKTMNKFYGSLSSAMDNLNESLDDTRKYRDNMSGLAKNLSSLNQIYGNMLSAMAMGAQGK